MTSTLRLFRGILPVIVALALPILGGTTATASIPAPLPFARVLQWPLVWPEKVTTSEAFSDGSTEVAAGAELRLQDVQRDGLVVQLPGNGELTLIPAEWTDLGARAARVQQSLPEDVRTLAVADLVKRTDLLPEFVSLVDEITLANGRTLAAGTRMIPGRLQLANGTLGLVLVEQDAPFNNFGSLDRLVFNAEFTDVIARIREQARLAPAARQLRASANLEGKLVDPEGKPLPPAAVKPQYYVIYHAAGWCGWCHKFTPTLLKFYEEIKARHPEVEVVYLSSDRSAEEMAENFRKSAMPWPAVAFEHREAVRGLLAMAGPGTPHLMVLTADGKALHDGQPVGANGANAALTALRRELNRPRPAN